MRERGQRPSRPDRRRRGGQRAREQLPPPPRAPETARPRQRTAKRRRGGRRRRRPGGTRAREPAAPSLPSAQGAPLSRRSSAADADGSDEHGAQTGGTAAGCSRPKGAEQTPLPRAQSGARPSGRATGQATGRKADGRDGAAGESGRLCASVAVFSAGGGEFCLFCRKSARKGEKTQKRGLSCVEQCDILVLRRV